MSELSAIKAEIRNGAGKGAARATRNAGFVPGVIYGNKQAPTLIKLDPRVIWAEIRKSGWHSRLFEVDLGGTKESAVIRDIQFHPVTDQPVHVDFLRVDPTSKLHVTVPVHFINESKSPGIKKGGVLNIVAHEIDVTCDAGHMPKEFVIDLEGLEIGTSIHISAIAFPEGVKPTHAGDVTIATIVAPTVAPAASEG